MQVIRTLPARLYRGEEAFARERDALLRGAWRLVGHESMLAAAGEYVTDIIAGAPILLVRGEFGAVRAFHNVCRHRAGPLVEEGQGACAGEFVCRYHGWRYTLDGRLRSATDFGAAEGFDPRDYALWPVRLETWRGFLFATLDADAAPLMETLAPLETIWAERQVAEQPYALRRTHEIACNWKAYVENYLEGYHVPKVHAALSAEIDASAYRVEMRGRVAIHHAPSRETANAVYDGLWAWVWPDLGINVYRFGMMIEKITPLAPRRTRLDYLYFYDPARVAELDDAVRMSDIVTAEDKDICERVQENLDAGIYEMGVLSPKHEKAVAWFQAEIAKAHA